VQLRMFGMQCLVILREPAYRTVLTCLVASLRFVLDVVSIHKWLFSPIAALGEFEERNP
jgi:hypothetical protein